MHFLQNAQNLNVIKYSGVPQAMNSVQKNQRIIELSDLENQSPPVAETPDSERANQSGNLYYDNNKIINLIDDDQKEMDIPVKMIELEDCTIKIPLTKLDANVHT